MQRTKLFTLSLALFLAACQRGPVISSGPIDLGSTAVRISMERTGVSVGPTRQVCLTMAPNDADSIANRRHRPESYRTPIHVVLIPKVGLQDTLGSSDGASDIRLDRHTLCVWDHGLSAPWTPPKVSTTGETILVAKPGTPRRAEYVAMEIWSDRPVHVQAVRWWSGQRKAIL